MTTLLGMDDYAVGSLEGMEGQAIRGWRNELIEMSDHGMEHLSETLVLIIAAYVDGGRKGKD